MYKLTVVAGPNRGTSYAVGEGSHSIGRQGGNLIVLSSSKVSKKHCALEVSGEEFVVKDLGSANGTFVNGVLTRQRKLGPGDRISVGDFVLEVVRPREPGGLANAPALADGLGGRVLQFPGSRLPGMPGGAPLPGQQSAADLPSGPPKDLPGKAIWYFENRLMPFFYGMLLKNQWRSIGIGIFGAFMVGNLLISVYPLVEQGRQSTIREAQRRARVMARQVAERNTAALASRAETKTEIGPIDREPGVRSALLVDLDSRVIAPAARMNQYFNIGPEAAFVARLRNLYREGKEDGLSRDIGEDIVVAVEPVKVLNPALGRNQVVALAVVSLDLVVSTPDPGEVAMAYSETLIMTGLLGAFLFLIFYRLTLKPLEILNEDIDRVLKGEMGQVTREFKFVELEQLFDVINSTLQRIPKGADADAGGGAAAVDASPDYAGALAMLGKLVGFGMVVLDAERKVKAMNAAFEEVTGIRSEAALGQDLSGLARDQAFRVFIGDLFDRVPIGSEGIAEDFEFSGIPYKIHAAAIGTGSIGGYILCAVRSDG